MTFKEFINDYAYIICGFVAGYLISSFRNWYKAFGLYNPPNPHILDFYIKYKDECKTNLEERDQTMKFYICSKSKDQDHADSE